MNSFIQYLWIASLRHKDDHDHSEGDGAEDGGHGEPEADEPGEGPVLVVVDEEELLMVADDLLHLADASPAPSE